MDESEPLPKGFRVLLSEEDEKLSPKIVVTHRIEFSAEDRDDRYDDARLRRRRRSINELPWSASMIEDVRRQAKVPDDADLTVTTRRVVFTWQTEWAGNAKPNRKGSAS